MHTLIRPSMCVNGGMRKIAKRFAEPELVENNVIQYMCINVSKMKEACFMKTASSH